MTTDDVRITLRANVDLPEEAELAAKSGAEGVGLMRTEFLVMNRASMPDEDEQYRAYKRVVEAFGGRPVVIRTFDLGGDKLPVGGFPVGAESVPRLARDPHVSRSARAVRRAASRPAARRGARRRPHHAAARSSRSTRCALAREMLDEAARALEARGVEFRRNVPLGVMVETPAAAVSCDTLVNDVAFFSIGTNDLVQYTLAVDRGNANLATRFTPLHPAVLKLIKRTVDTAHEYDLDVAVCGEMASQPLMAFALIGLGVRQMSVAPRSVPLVKRIVRGISVAAAEEAASAALAAATAAEAEGALRRRLAGVLGGEALFGDGHARNSA